MHDVYSFNLTICGQDLHRILTHSQEKGNPCLWSDFPSFCSDFICFYTHFPKIFHDFYQIFYPFDPCFGILLGGGQNGTNLHRFFCVKSTHLNVTSPCILHISNSSPSALVGAPKYFWFHQFMACIVMRISQPNYEKVVGKGHLFEKAYVKSP